MRPAAPRERQTREAAAGTEIDEAVDAAVAEDRATAVRLSTTWARATAAGSRMAVRLIAVVQASRSRAWPSIAARASGRERQAAGSQTGVEGGS